MCIYIYICIHICIYADDAIIMNTTTAAAQIMLHIIQ